MNEMMQFSFALFAGMLLGALFFGGLWWTIRQGVVARQPALWFALSLLLRTGMTLFGLYFVAGDDWTRLLACLAGFIIARFIVINLTATRITEALSHAP